MNKNGSMIKMSVKIILIAIILIIIPINSFNSKGTIVADWGDVVNVRYTLYVDASYSETYNEANTNVTLNYIYLSTGTSVPSSIHGMFPQASSSYLVKFEEGIIGLQVLETKNFTIDAADAYNSGDLAGQNLYFKVTLLEILYDASAQEEITTTTITTTTITSTTTTIITTTTTFQNVTHSMGWFFIITSLGLLVKLFFRNKK